MATAVFWGSVTATLKCVMRKWRDSFTIERVDKLIREWVALYGIEYPPEGQTLDVDYMASGWAYRYKDV